ncbi:MAG TPA: adenosylcobinamide-phosphate synthase CbiB [Opitutaceae bacterium]|nr:adenosylcobinamide-phosphate synthase CbiB [Opitutaceae bacterium]
MVDARLTAVALIGGYALDLALGDPAWLPHPVVGFGRAIAAGERALNRGRAGRRFVAGMALALGLVGGVFALTFVLERAAWRLHPFAGVAFVAAGVFFGLANRTLVDEGRAVFAALAENLAAGRRRLARIVGRDTAALDVQQVRTAVCETMAENLCDGVVAPLCWFAVLGLPGLVAYKMINTLDSMIGHRDARHEWFGKTAARLDDVANFLPARFTALLQCALAGSGRGFAFVACYGRAHASPNSGYPEAALAGILDVRFGGPHTYDGERVDKPWIGRNPRPIAAAEIASVARLNHAVAAVAVLAVAAVWWYIAPAQFLLP